LKKLKINYLLIGIVTLLLAAALWPSIPWFGKAENRIAAIQAWCNPDRAATPSGWVNEGNSARTSTLSIFLPYYSFCTKPNAVNG
jgi:membrane-bound lytic murein transglycosylase F